VRGVAGSLALLTANLTGFGGFEPVRSSRGRYRVAAAGALSGDIILASTLAVAINPWGNFAIVKLPRQ
jgi:hypothetical protein